MKSGTKKLFALFLLGLSIVISKQKLYSGDPFALWLESIIKYPYDVFYNPLFIAVQSNNIPKAKKLLDSGKDPNEKDRYGNTPLIYAASNGNIEMVKLLLNYKANPNIKGYKSNTPLIHAIQQGHIKVIDLLLQNGAEIIPLSEAIKYSQKTKTIEHLFQQGATLDVSLHEIAQNPSIVKSLLKEGANPNEKDSKGRTPLHNAAQKNEPQSIAILLAAGADPNTQDNNGETPLYYVSNPDIVQKLIESGANLFITNNNGKSLLHVHVKRWRLPWEKGPQELVSLLLDKGLNINQQDTLGNTPLHAAVTRRRNTQIIKLLSQKGADPSIKNKAGLTAYDIARFNNDWKAMAAITWYRSKG